jgi:hypothetical protein
MVQDIYRMEDTGVVEGMYRWYPQRMLKKCHNYYFLLYLLLVAE